MGSEYDRALTGEWYPGDGLLRNLIYRASRWIDQPEMRRMIEALANELLDEDWFGRMTSQQIDRVLKDAVPSWSRISRW